MERRAASGGCVVATIAARLAPRTYQTPAAATMISAAIPALSSETRERSAGRQGPGPASRPRGLRLRRLADLERIDPDRVGDVLELLSAEIGDREIEPPLDLPVGLLGQTDRARLGDALKPRCDIDAIAHQVAVALLDDVAQMNADAEFDAALGRQAGIALDHAALHLDRAAHRIDHATKLNEASRHPCA